MQHTYIYIHTVHVCVCIYSLSEREKTNVASCQQLVNLYIHLYFKVKSLKDCYNNCKTEMGDGSNEVLKKTALLSITASLRVILTEVPCTASKTGQSTGEGAACQTRQNHAVENQVSTTKGSRRQEAAAMRSHISSYRMTRWPCRRRCDPPTDPDRGGEWQGWCPTRSVERAQIWRLL